VHREHVRTRREPAAEQLVEPEQPVQRVVVQQAQHAVAVTVTAVGLPDELRRA
jgi:hypothetical protein